MTEKKSPFKINGLTCDFVKINSLPDGNCYFHSILRAFCLGYINGSNIERVKYVNFLRNYLADYLIKKNSDGSSIYENLSNSNLKKFSKDVNEYSLDNMINELKSNNPVDNLYQELISNIFNLDIYIIDLFKQDLYKTGSDLNLLYKNRNSIIIGFSYEKENSVGHYDTIGLNINNKIHTLFSNTHFLSIFLKKKLKN